MIFHPRDIKFIIQTNMTEEKTSNVYEIEELKRIKLVQVQTDIMILKVNLIQFQCKNKLT